MGERNEVERVGLWANEVRRAFVFLKYKNFSRLGHGKILILSGNAKFNYDLHYCFVYDLQMLICERNE